MHASAILRFVRVSPQKGRLVADQIRGLSVERALEILQFSPKKAAKPLKKVLESAIANAEHNQGADIDALKVQAVLIDAGAMLKRFHARAKGRGARILKRTSHITVIVSDAKKAAADAKQETKETAKKEANKKEAKETSKSPNKKETKKSKQATKKSTQEKQT